MPVDSTDKMNSGVGAHAWAIGQRYRQMISGVVPTPGGSVNGVDR